MESVRWRPLFPLLGHTHIDVAWLWRLRQTRDKTSRSFATVLKLMEEYPDYRFMSSQAQLYEFIRQEHPAIFARIRESVRQGRWEPEGGMWVEADTNLSSGESLVRQFLVGKRFFPQCVRRGLQNPLATGCVRLQRRPAADYEAMRDQLFYDHQDSGMSMISCLTTPSFGAASTAARCSRILFPPWIRSRRRRIGSPPIMGI